MRKGSIRGLIIIFILNIVFHLLVLAHVIPSNIVWGGRVKDNSELMRLEFVSLGLNAFFLLIALSLNGNIKAPVKPSIIRILLWLMGALFVLNTIGNLFAKSNIETMIFTPVTFLLSIFCLYLAINFKAAK